MEKRINDKILVYMDNMKSSIKSYIEDNDNMLFDDKSELVKFVYDLDRLQITKEDFAKRKRSKSVVPYYARCVAKKACGEQCTRKKQTGSEFCGTHDKNRPHGVVTSETDVGTTKNIEIEIWMQEINGIIYYIDKNNNIYKTEDIKENSKNPQIIAKYEKENDVYKFLPSYAS